MPRLSIILLLLLAGCDNTTERESNTEFHGRWLVLNYWAEWCKPCIEEIPELNTLSRSRPDDLAVVAINFDGLRGEALQQASDRAGINYRQMPSDPAERWGYPRPAVLPTTLIFDPAGTLIHTLAGPQTANKLLQLIAEK